MKSADTLSNVRFVEEKALISKFFEDISLDTGNVVFGVNDTIKALELSAVDKILMFEDIEITRYVVVNPVKDETRTYYLTPLQEKDTLGNMNPKYF